MTWWSTATLGVIGQMKIVDYKNQGPFVGHAATQLLHRFGELNPGASPSDAPGAGVGVAASDFGLHTDRLASASGGVALAPGRSSRPRTRPLNAAYGMPRSSS